VATVSRKVRFVTWVDASKRQPFDRLEAASAVGQIPQDELVFEEDASLTAVELVDVGSDSKPSCLAVLALRDFDNRPLGWGPGALPQPIQIGEDLYTADLAHAVIWGDKVAAIEVHPNSPGLGRLSRYLSEMTQQRVLFRSLYQPDLAERLADLEGLRGFEFGIYDPRKVQAARQTGLSSLIPQAFGPRIPSFRVSAGVGRRGGQDARLDEEISDEVLRLAARADEFFDSLKLSGKSKSLKTPAGQPKTVQINLLSERLQVEHKFAAAEGGGNIPNRATVVSGFVAVRKQLGDTLEKAVEARLSIEGQGEHDDEA
jgi:hypothetical protein